MARRLIDGIAFAHEKVTVSASSTSLTVNTWFPQVNGVASDEAANRAIISAENGIMRYLTTGDDPTATTGHIIAHGAFITLTGTQNIKDFRAIAVSGVGILQVTYERVR